MTDPRRRQSNLDLITLAAAAVASAVAAYFTSQVWSGGALFSAALTPVIVALVKEAVTRPADKLQTVRVQRTTRAPQPPPPPRPPGPPQPDDPTEPAPPPPEPTGAMSVYKTAGRHRWRAAVLTGVVAFVIVVLVYTVPELVAGKSIARGGNHATTLFGGKTRKSAGGKSRHRGRKATPTATGTATATPTPTASATPRPAPSPTVTPTPTPTASPTATATPTP